MARYIDAIDLPLPIEAALDYLADFSRVAEWDPGVDDARRITPGKIRLGSRFEVGVSLLGRRIPLEYRITEFDRPSHLVLSGGDASVRSVDEITFVARPGGTRVSYEARVDLVGIRRIAEPILNLLFQRIGRVAMRGLRERIEQLGAELPSSDEASDELRQSTERGRKRSKQVRKQRQSGRSVPLDEICSGKTGTL
jgi:carbon monoxide dehydrogenase subunit G